MTARPPPLLAAARDVAKALGLDASDARPLRVHDSVTYLLPREHIVVRMAAAIAENRERADLAVSVTRWLQEQGFPAVTPVHDAAIQIGAVVATLWRYLPEPAMATAVPELAAALGRLLRGLHALPAPPFRLPALDPFARLRNAIRLDDGRITPILSEAERTYLLRRIKELDAAYSSLDFPLGHGLVHNDAHIGNLLASADSPDRFVLIDWESARWGPREIDLVQEGAPGNRFGESSELRRAFSHAYGYRIAEWDGWRILRDARDLHSLAAYLRTAVRRPAAGVEVRRRLGSLRQDDRTVVWRAVR